MKIRGFGRKTVTVTNSDVSDNDIGVRFLESTPESLYYEIDNMEDCGDQIVVVNKLKAILSEYLDSIPLNKRDRQILHSIVYNNIDFNNVINDYSITINNCEKIYNRFVEYASNHIIEDVTYILRKYGKEIAEDCIYRVYEKTYIIHNGWTLEPSSSRIVVKHIKNDINKVNSDDWGRRNSSGFRRNVPIPRSKLFQDKKRLNYILDYCLYGTTIELRHLISEFNLNTEDILNNKKKFNKFFDKVDKFYKECDLDFSCYDYYEDDMLDLLYEECKDDDDDKVDKFYKECDLDFSCYDYYDDAMLDLLFYEECECEDDDDDTF